jgi:hypothetical protein
VAPDIDVRLIREVERLRDGIPVQQNEAEFGTRTLLEPIRPIDRGGVYHRQVVNKLVDK